MKFFRPAPFVFAALFAGCFPSLDGLTSSGAPADAAAQQSDSAADAGTLDSGPGDSGSIRDAVVDAGPWCASNTPANTFCCDFDTTTLSVFTNQFTSGGASIAIDDGQSDSPPKSLLSTIPVLTAPSDAGAFAQAAVIYASTQPTSNSADFAASIRVDKFGSTSTAQILDFVFAGAVGTYEMRLNIDADGKLYMGEFDVKAGIYGEPFHAPDPIAAGVWTQVHFHVNLVAPGQGTADLDVGGKRVVTALALKPPFASGSLRTSLGSPFVRSPSSGWATRIDNLLLAPK